MAVSGASYIGQTSISSATPGTTPLMSALIYPSGKPMGGDGSGSWLQPGTNCPESVALAAGRAVTHVAADKSCKGVQGITINIGDTWNSIHSGFSMVNVNFGCNGEQGCCASFASLEGPVVG